MRARPLSRGALSLAPAVGIALLAAGLRVLFFLRASVATEVLGADLVWYAFQGANLAAGRGIVNPDGSPTAFFPPGTALLLAPLQWAFGAALPVHVILNAACSFATSLLVFRFAARAYGRRVATLAALLLALCPGDVLYVGFALSEIPFQTFLMAVLVAYQALDASREGGRPLQWFGFGLLAGAASLIRGIALPLLPLAVGCSLLTRRSLRHAARIGLASALGLCVVVGPWVIRNRVVMGSFLFATDGSRALFIAHSSAAFGGQSFATGRAVSEAFPELARLPNPEAEVARSRAELAFALRYLLTHPVHELELIPRRLYHLYADDHALINAYRDAPDGGTSLRPEARWKRVWVAIADGYFHALLVLAALGLWRAIRPELRSRAPILPIAFLYFNLFHALVIFGIPRFHASFLPLLALLAALGAEPAVRGVARVLPWTRPSAV